MPTPSGDLDIIGKTLTIIGTGPGRTIIDGGAVDRVFDILGNSNVTLIGMTIRNGRPPDDGSGGGIRVGALAGLTLDQRRGQREPEHPGRRRGGHRLGRRRGHTRPRHPPGQRVLHWRRTLDGSRRHRQDHEQRDRRQPRGRERGRDLQPGRDDRSPTPGSSGTAPTRTTPGAAPAAGSSRTLVSWHSAARCWRETWSGAPAADRTASSTWARSSRPWAPPGPRPDAGSSRRCPSATTGSG